MPEWTEEQLDAIRARRGTVLVSAAAGSGKTAVLTERVIERLTDPEHPTDADRLLVVTFTKAAAAEMRERIEKRLLALIAERPDDLRLRRQQLLLQQAMICTVDSFCTAIVREFFYLLGISPDFSVVSDKQREELMAEAAEEVAGEMYAGEAFRRLADAVSGDRDDRRLLELIRRLYEYTRSHPFPETWLRETVSMFDGARPAAQTPWGRTALRHAAEALLSAQRLSESAYSVLLEDAGLLKGYGAAIRSDIDTVNRLTEAVESGDWDRVSAAFRSLSFQNIGRYSGSNGQKERVKAMRESVKKEVTALGSLFLSDDAACRAEFAALRPLAESLEEAVLRFEAVFSEKKRAKNLLDFSDLEHFALRLFWKETENGYERTETAKTVAARFDEVMTDEYQDTNEAQDFLFRAVSKDGENRFMVGDVKQSIYSFRQATPDCFIRYRDAFPRYDLVADRYPASVVLGRNFRSRKEVTESVNFVFGLLMSREAGGVDYGGDERLIPGADYPEKRGCETEVTFLEDADGLGGETLEPRFIAERIRRMLAEGFTVTENGAERPARLRDFCVLLRSSNRYAPLYAESLRALGIPAWAAVSGGFFAASEVSLLLAFLSVIDNPNQDVPLLAVLMSPIYGFTAEDLAEMRRERGADPVYVSLLKSEDGRAKTVLEDLTRWRVLAASMAADVFIALLTEQTGFANIVRAMPGGESRLANLRLLERYAAEYERGGTGGLSGFLRFVDRLRRSRSDMEAANVISESADVVRIMSIHKSKGLEFPVCFVAGCGRQFAAEHSDLLLHPQLGMGMRLADPETGVRRTTLPREAISIALSESAASEELRVFYVAMTRAKEKLILLSTVKTLDTVLERLAAQITPEEKITPFVVNGVKSASEWLLLCALRHPDGEVLRRRVDLPEQCVVREGYAPWRVETVYLPPAREKAQETAAPAPVDERFRAEVEAALSYRYPFEAETRMPTKVSASGLAAVQSPEAGTRTLRRPSFLSAKGLTPAERGTALHDFMQFCAPKAAAKDARSELSRLVAEKYLTPEQAAAVDLRRVERFFAGPLGQRVLSADRVSREQRFIAPIPMRLVDSSLTGEDAETPVILQGAVDCMIEEGGVLSVIDFKTDRIADKALLWARYGTQLKLYAEAMSRVFQKPVGSILLYSFFLNDTVGPQDA